MSRVPAPSLGQNQGLVSATEGSGGDDGGAGHRAHRWSPRQAACWLVTRGAEALSAWWALGPAGVPAGMASVVAAVARAAETEGELVSSGGGLRELSRCRHGGVGLGGARETCDLSQEHSG